MISQPKNLVEHILTDVFLLVRWMKKGKQAPGFAPLEISKLKLLVTGKVYINKKVTAFMAQ